MQYVGDFLMTSTLTIDHVEDESTAPFCTRTIIIMSFPFNGIIPVMVTYKSAQKSNPVIFLQIIEGLVTCLISQPKYVLEIPYLILSVCHLKNTNDNL